MVTAELLNEVLDFQPTITFLTDGNGMLFANKALLRFFESDSMEEFVSKSSCICEHFIARAGFLPNERGKWMQQVEANKKAGKESHTIIKKGDKEHIFKVSIELLPSKEGFKIVTLEDMSAYFKAKEELEESNRMLESKVLERTWELVESGEELENQKRMLEESQEIAKLGSWDYAVSDKRFDASKEFFSIFGFDKVVRIKPMELLRYLYRKDIQKLFMYLRGLKNNEDTMGINLRILDLDKKPKTIRFYAKLFADEFGTVYRVRGALQDITEAIDLKERAFLDHLTKIYNRRRMGELLESAVNADGSVGLIMFDIDRFKSINDTYGHPVGDSVLVEMATLIKRQLGEDAIFARWGGEEFMVAVPDSSSESILACAEKLRSAVESFNFSDVGRVTCSFGAVVFGEGETVFEGIKRCDDALYVAKKSGRNCVIEG